jgi:hypothetical protein
MALKLSALLAGMPLPPGRFLVLISVWGWVTEESNDLIANRIHHFPACSIIPEPATATACPRLLKCTLQNVRNVFVSYWIYTNCTKWDPLCPMHKSQFCKLQGRCIPVNARERFRLTDFSAIRIHEFHSTFWASYCKISQNYHCLMR